MKRITYIVVAFGIVAMAAASARAVEPGDKIPVQEVQDDFQSGIAYGTNRAQTFEFYDNRARGWLAQNDYDKAIADYNRAISIDANSPAYYNDLALLQATSLDPVFRDAKQAFANASKAYQLANGSNANGTFSALAAAYAENGDFTKAVEWQAKAIDLTKNNELKQRYLARLELFKQGKPFRMDPKAAAKASAPSANK